MTIKVRLITEADNVKSGDTLYYQPPFSGGLTKAVIERVTKTTIIWSGLKFNRNGRVKGDKYAHASLYIPIAQKAEKE